MDVLLSIKPEFADKIFNGTKKYEFRKAIFKRTDVHRVIVYASSPVQRVIGEFQIESILNDSVENLWKRTSEYSGITKDFYHQYFSGRDQAFAIQVGRIKRFKKEKTLQDYNINFAPQSYVYIEN